MRRRKTVLRLLVLCVGLLMAFTYQSDFANTLQQKLTLYYQRHVPAKIHLSFDLPRYLPGDTAYYKIRYFTADALLPIGGRQILNVKLLDSTGNELHQAKILVVNGLGFNQIPLPDDLSPGRYSVVVFSDAMKRGHGSLFFHQPLWVIGEFRTEERNEDLPLSFFPEGGSLVAGITNKVVITGTANTSGKIISSEGIEIVTYGLDEKGIGVFFITPAKDKLYFARSSDGSKEKLPATITNGVGLLATVPANRSPIRITVQIPAESELKFQRLVLAMTGHGSVYYTATITFGDKNFQTFSLPQENLPEGIATITVFNEHGIPYAERLVYVRGDPHPEARIILSKERYQTREQIPVEIEVPSSEVLGLGSSLAVTVFHNEYLAGAHHGGSTIVENALINGDLSGSIKSSENFLDWNPGSLDNFLITSRPGAFQWNDVWTEKPAERPFRRFLNVEGSVQRTDGRLLPESTVITFFFQRSVMTYVVDLDPSGQFDLPLLMDFYGDEEVYFLVESGGVILPDVKVVLSPGVSLKVTGPSISTLPDKDEFFALGKKLDQISNSYSYHLLNRFNPRPPSLNALIEDEVFGADFAVRLDDYFMFPTMSEVLRELIPVLQHRKQKNRDIIKLFLDDRNRFAVGEPLFVIDGVITDNTAYFLSLKPADVATIKVIYSVQKLQAFGAVGKNGIVLVETKIPDHAAVVPRSANVFTARGIERVSPYHRPRTLSRNSRVPDLRTNLYWNPDLMTDSTGRTSFSITASDVTGTFTIVAEGFTADRKPVFVKKEFEVLFE